MSLDYLQSELADIVAQQRYRKRQLLDSPQGLHSIIDGRCLLNFCSNDYLGLANHPDMIDAVKRCVDRYGVGSGSAHLICGHSYEHHALEEELAAFTGRERALLFSTGYMANLGIITSLLSAKDSVLEDKLNHASLLDGGLFSKAQFYRYAHGDLGHLSQLLTKSSGRKLIVTDGVFSMDGDIAPLPQLTTLAMQHNALLMVDDAHGIGVLGENGGGLLDYYQLNSEQVPILMGTLGKALGSFGAFVAGSEVLIEALIQKARSYIYTTALPPSIAAASRCSLRLVASQAWRREQLQYLITYFQMQARQSGLPLMPSNSPIQPIHIGDSQRAVNISQALKDAGFLVTAIRPPTVPKETARLRITLCAHHNTSHIDQLIDVLSKTLTQFSVR